MAYSSPFTCDVCGIHKKVLNKWFLVEALIDRITIFPFDSKDAKVKHIAILCGENCLQRYLSQRLILLHKEPKLPVPSETALGSNGAEAPGEN
jgi:hypothetical protein